MIDGDLYAFGGDYTYQDIWGWESNFYPDCFKIDPYDAAAAWTEFADMPTARTGAMSVVYDYKVYVFGGKGREDSTSTTVEAYDPVTDTWATKSSSPFELSYGHALKVGEKIYLIDGAYVLEYDPALEGD